MLSVLISARLLVLLGLLTVGRGRWGVIAGRLCLWSLIYEAVDLHAKTVPAAGTITCYDNILRFEC